MGWVKRKRCSMGDVNRAGGILIDGKSTEEEKNRALEILDNWRAIHSYPMHIFKKRLKDNTG